jgi:hypothetical protein
MNYEEAIKNEDHTLSQNAVLVQKGFNGNKTFS